MCSTYLRLRELSFMVVGWGGVRGGLVVIRVR